MYGRGAKTVERGCMPLLSRQRRYGNPALLVTGRIQDSPGQGDNLISWYIEYSYQNYFVRKVPLTVQGYQVVPKEQIFVSISDILRGSMAQKRPNFSDFGMSHIGHTDFHRGKR